MANHVVLIYRQHSMGGDKSQQLGFTLLELTVVIALFTVFTLVVVDLSTQVQRELRLLQQRAEALQEVKLVMEAMTRDIQTMEIDYDQLDWPPAGQTADLYLRDELGTARHYRFGSITDCDDCLLVATDDSAVLRQTHSPRFVVDGGFIITPIDDPFAQNANGTFAANQQPLVTIWASIEDADITDPERSRIHFQTTVSARSYKR